MKPQVSRRIRAAVQNVELLEARCLLSATSTATIPSQEIVTTSGPTTVNLASFLSDPQLTGGTVVEMQTPVGNIPLQLTDAQTPLTVANFETYIRNGEYTPTIIQRVAAGFVIQGGGTKPDGSNNSPVQTLQGEPGISNTIGTIAMALSSGPNSGTNQWFINLGDNSQTLDGTADGGPFTVFGNVIDNGMSVVNAIAGLQLVDGSTENGNWGGAQLGGAVLPVLPGYTGSSTPTTVDPSSLVTDNVVNIPAGQTLTYTATSDNTNVVTASIANGVLTLAAPDGVTAGQANVTITATDLSGQTASQTVAVGVNGFYQPVTIGSGGVKSATYTDANGTTAVFSLKGAGSAVVNFTSNASITAGTTAQGMTVTSSSAVSVHDISITGTDATSVLTITTKGGTKAINIGPVTTTAIKSISAKGVTLADNLTASGAIGSLVIAGATGGTVDAPSIGTLTVSGAFSDPLQLTDSTGLALNKFTAGSVTGGPWSIAGTTNSVTAKSASTWTPDFLAPVKTITINGDFGGTISATTIGTLKVAGNFMGTINAASITNLMIKKNLDTSTVRVTASGTALGKLTVGGAITGSQVNAIGSIGAVAAASLVNSQIYAGVGNLATGQPLPNLTDFSSNESIASVKLKTVKTGDSFSNSDIAAETLGKLSLGTILTSNGGMPTGVSADTIAAFTATANKKVNLKKLTTATDLTTLLSTEGVILGDFQIKLV